MNEKYTYARKNDELFCFDYFERINDVKYEKTTISLANLCNKGDIVNGEKVKHVDIGMNGFYCVITVKNPPHINCESVYYSFHIKTIETPKKKYRIDDFRIEEMK